jgi:hypothetical protein
MQNYYFTFGQEHCTKDGYPLKDHWVRVLANNYWRARDIFIEEFTSVFLPEKDKWSMEYTEKAFTKQFFSKGEYQFIADIRNNKIKNNEIQQH